MEQTPFLEVPKVSKRFGPKSNHCGMTMMTMIALVLKILVIIMMMMMTIVVTGKKDNHKDDNTRKRQKYNDDDRKRKIFKNSRPGKIV